jgi:hypothetical protein
LITDATDVTDVDLPVVESSPRTSSLACAAASIDLPSAHRWTAAAAHP